MVMESHDTIARQQYFLLVAGRYGFGDVGTFGLEITGAQVLSLEDALTPTTPRTHYPTSFLADTEVQPASSLDLGPDLGASPAESNPTEDHYSSSGQDASADSNPSITTSMNPEENASSSSSSKAPAGIFQNGISGTFPRYSFGTAAIILSGSLSLQLFSCV
jgi:hypothetical protein